AERLDAGNDLADRAARGHHVLDHEAPLAGRDGESTAQTHHALFTLGEERAHAERAGDLVSDRDAADRRSQHGLDAVAPERRGQRRAESLGVLGILEDQRRLQIHVRVQSRGQPEVAAPHGAGGLLEGERLAVGPGAASWATIVAAAAAGSLAALTGRPTTR